MNVHHRKLNETAFYLSTLKVTRITANYQIKDKSITFETRPHMKDH